MRRKSPHHVPPVPLQDPAWQRLLLYGRARRLAPGAILYRQGEAADCCYYVNAGRVKAVILRPDGTEKILEVMGPGALLGEAAAIDGQCHYSTCIALDPTEVYAFTVSALVERMQADAAVARHLLRVMARKQRVLARQVEDMAFLSTTARVARLLSRLAEDYGVSTAAGPCIVLQLTHEQIASMVGASRVGVTRALTRLRQQGAIAPAAEGWLRCDPARLAAACSSED